MWVLLALLTGFLQVQRFGIKTALDFRGFDYWETGFRAIFCIFTHVS